MTVRVLDYAGDGTYFLADPALELDGLRRDGPGSVLAGDANQSIASALGRALEVPQSDGRRALDVIVAAPKPVSVLLATEPTDVARSVVALHEQGVGAALRYLCDEGLGRRATTGVPRAVGFTHGINRMLDPHLHTHVVLSLHDDRGVPLDARSVRAYGRAADALYLATLRAGLPDAARRDSWVTSSGRMHVDGVDLGLLAAMSTPRDRRGRIERSGSKTHPSATAVREHWDGILASFEPVECPLEAPARTGRLDEYRFAAVLGDGFVTRRQVVRAWATASRFGHDADGVLASVSLLASGLTGSARRPAVVLRDGAGVRVLGSRPVEAGALRSWLVGRDALDQHLAKGFSLGRVLNRRGASARERLSLARLDAATIDTRARDRALQGARETSHGRALS
ncbi:MAG TPA: relaxase domain-containing protein [Acidimicrobiales bacterium]|nr:relaxase domain-containing protein [Acidimicrobiales bacterium]